MVVVAYQFHLLFNEYIYAGDNTDTEKQIITPMVLIYVEIRARDGDLSVTSSLCLVNWEYGYGRNNYLGQIVKQFDDDV